MSQKNQEKEIETQALWLYIRNNKPHTIGLAPIKKYKKILHPIIQTRFTTPISLTWKITNQSKKNVQNLLISYYKDLLQAKIYHPGYYGDWIKCSELTFNNEKFLNIDLIGQAAWPKASLAADLGIFVKNNKKIFFICIVRKNKPGKGKPAIVGGFLNVGSVLDSGAYTILKETMEEANLEIKYAGNLKKLRENYTISTIPVIVKGFDQISTTKQDLLAEIKADMHYITTIPTTKQDLLADGTKRVYIAIAYAILIDIKKSTLTKNILQKVFKAGDDADEMHYCDITDYFTGKDNKNHPSFGLKHHLGLFKQMVKFLQKTYDVSF